MKNLFSHGCELGENYQAPVELTKSMIHTEDERLFQYGFNSITKTHPGKSPNVLEKVFSTPILKDGKPLIGVPDYAYTQLNKGHSTLLCVKSCLKCVKPSITNLGFDLLPFKEVHRKHVKLVMNHFKEKRLLSEEEERQRIKK